MIVPDLESNNSQTMNTASLNIKDEALLTSDVILILI